MRRLFCLLALVVGCSKSPSTQTEILPDLAVTAKPLNGYQFIFPIVRALAPGTDNEYCTWTNIIPDHDIDVRVVQGFQTASGHHIIMYTTPKTQPPGTTRLCTEDDMSTFRFGAGAGGEGSSSVNEAPGNLVYRVAAGSQIVINHHYINATTHTLDAQSAVNITLADPGKQYVPAASLAVLDTSFHLPPGPSTLDVSCTFDRGYKVWYVAPHMHENGTHIVVEHISGSTIDKLIDTEWSPAYMFAPPEMRLDPASPLELKPADQIHVRCQWNNPTANDLTFGLEMCVGYLETIDADGVGNMSCDKGRWGSF